MRVRKRTAGGGTLRDCETQRTGSSIIVLGFSDGMHLTNRRHRRKIFRELRPDMWVTIAAIEMPQRSVDVGSHGPYPSPLAIQ